MSSVSFKKTHDVDRASSVLAASTCSTCMLLLWDCMLASLREPHIKPTAKYFLLGTDNRQLFTSQTDTSHLQLGQHIHLQILTPLAGTLRLTLWYLLHWRVLCAWHLWYLLHWQVLFAWCRDWRWVCCPASGLHQTSPWLQQTQPVSKLG